MDNILSTALKNGFQCFLQTARELFKGKNDLTEEFKECAKLMLENFCIMQDNVEFRFLEIEFYWKSPEHDDSREDGTPFVYPRNSTRDGVFFLHDSGVDICFEGSVESGRYGGILLRSLLRTELDENGRPIAEPEVITCPWDCRDALFNYVDVENFPKIVCRQFVNFNTDKVTPVKRCNAKGNMAERLYGFYDKGFYEDYWWKIKGTRLRRYAPKRIGADSKALGNYSNKPWNREK